VDLKEWMFGWMDRQKDEKHLSIAPFHHAWQAPVLFWLSVLLCGQMVQVTLIIESLMSDGSCSF